MNTITPEALKKLLYSSVLALMLIVLFVVVKTLFVEKKHVQLKEFKTPDQSRNTISPEVSETNTTQTRFLLLPKK